MSIAVQVSRSSRHHRTGPVVSCLGIGFLSLSIFVLLSAGPAFADPEVQITQCGTVISQPGHYILAHDLSCNGPNSIAPTTGTPNFRAAWGPLKNPLDGSTIAVPAAPTQCFPTTDGIDIVADHVELALDGHTISNPCHFGFAGIVVKGSSDVHIIGPGTITGFDEGVIFSQVSFSSVSEVTATSDFLGFVLEGAAPDCAPGCFSTKNDFRGNTALAFTGFMLEGANDNTLRDNNFNNNSLGIFLVFGAGNDVRDNTGISGHGTTAGIVLDAINATDNDITHNTVEGYTPGNDLVDLNNNCTTNRWKDNTFDPGGAFPSCIE